MFLLQMGASSHSRVGSLDQWKEQIEAVSKEMSDAG